MSSLDEVRRARAIRDEACDHTVGICWGKPLPTPEQITAIREREHEQAGCAHAIGVCRRPTWHLEPAGHGDTEGTRESNGLGQANRAVTGG